MSKIIFYIFLFLSLCSCSVFKGVEGVKGNGAVEGGLPSKQLGKDYKKQQKRQQKSYDREMKKRAKRLGTTKKR